MTILNSESCILTCQSLKWLFYRQIFIRKGMNPYIPLTCEEVLAIKELSNYAKTRVRLFGRLQICQSKRGIEFRTLQSLGEELESKVLIDFRLDNFDTMARFACY